MSSLTYSYSYAGRRMMEWNENCIQSSKNLTADRNEGGHITNPILLYMSLEEKRDGKHPLSVTYPWQALRL